MVDLTGSSGVCGGFEEVTVQMPFPTETAPASLPGGVPEWSGNWASQFSFSTKCFGHGEPRGLQNLEVCMSSVNSSELFLGISVQSGEGDHARHWRPVEVITSHRQQSVRVRTVLASVHKSNSLETSNIGTPCWRRFVGETRRCRAPRR